MRTMTARELRAAFGSMLGWGYIALLLLFGALAACIGCVLNLSGNYAQWISYIALSLIVGVPLLTCDAFALERRTGARRLLLSLPMGLMRVTLGKYFAFVVIHLVACLLMCLYPLALALFGTVPLLGSLCAIGQLFFLGMMLIALGLLVSALGFGRLVSALITFAVCVGLYYLPWFAALLENSALPALSEWLLYVAPFARLAYASGCVVDLTSMFYNLTMSALLAAIAALIAAHGRGALGKGAAR